MDLGKLIQLEEESRKKSLEASSDARKLIKAEEQKLYDAFRKTRKASFQDIKDLNTQSKINKRFESLSTKDLEPEIVLERILGDDNFLDVNYLSKALKVSKTVARITYPSHGNTRKPLGTGSLIAPNLMITNNHVISNPVLAANYFAEFDYEALDREGTIGKYVSFNFRPDLFFITNAALDYTILAVSIRSENEEKLLFDYGYNIIGNNSSQILVGEPVNIIQHPLGRPKQIAFRDNKVLKVKGKNLIYGTDTDRGSSGSLVLNDQWEVVALHRAGVPQLVNGKTQWVANQGVLIEHILEDLEQKLERLSTSEKNELIEILKPYKNKKKESFRYVVPGSEKKADATNLITLKQTTNSEKTEKLQSYYFDAIIQYSFSTVEENIKKTFPQAQVRSLVTPNNDKKIFKNLSHIIKIELPDTGRNIWEIAQELEAVAGIVEVDPDIEEGENLVIDLDANEHDDAMEGLELFKKKPANNKNEIEQKYPGIQAMWNHGKTKFPQAIQYAIQTGKLLNNTGIKIAQIDTGYTHHDKILSMNKKEGYDFFDQDSIAHDDNLKAFPLRHPAHGTRTASVLIGGSTHLIDDLNQGVFPFVNYVPFRVSDSVIVLARRTAEYVAEVVLKAIREEYEIIVMSMGGLGKSVLRLAAKEAYENGLIWVCAAGNQVRYPNFVVRPAAYPGTIAAAASNYLDKPWSGSMRGPEVDITAPGEQIYVPKFDEKGNATFSYGSGTSYAVPHIAGAAALWLHVRRLEIENKYGKTIKDKWKRVEAFRLLLHQTARTPKGWNTHKMGAGILDVDALIKKDLPIISDDQHAYKQKSFAQHLKKYKNQSNQLAQKELLSYVWNNQGKLKSISQESMSIGLSQQAFAYLESMNLQEHAEERLNTKSEEVLIAELIENIKDWDQ